jgi:hypothetical protein
VGRWRALDQEVHNLDELIEPLVCKAAPALLTWPDVGSDVAASLLLAAGRQPWTSA